MASDAGVGRTSEKSELFILKLSTLLTIIYAMVGVTIAIICDSMTMMLDGLYGVADTVVSLLAISVVRKVHLPPNDQYHFGYAKYEPFMTAVDGILIISICAATILSAIQDVIHPDPVNDIHLAIGYSFISIFVCTGFGLHMTRVGKRCRSSILQADAQLWIIEGAISLGVFLAFSLSVYLAKTGWKGYTDYIDPVMSITLSVFLLIKPIRIIRDSFHDLIDASPDAELKKEIVGIVQACAEEQHLKGIKSVKLRKAGRQLFVNVHFLADNALSLGQTATVKQYAIEKIVQAYPEVDVTVLFSGR